MKDLEASYPAYINSVGDAQSDYVPAKYKSNITKYILELENIDLAKFNLDHLIALGITQEKNSRMGEYKQNNQMVIC